MDKDRKALVTSLVAALDRAIQDRLLRMLYDACGGRIDDFLESLRVLHDQRRIWKNFAEVLSTKRELQKQNLTEDERTAKHITLFIEASRDWAEEDPKRIVTEEELYWWVCLSMALGIGHLFWEPLFIQTTEHDPKRFIANFNRMKRERAIPASLSAADFGALLLSHPRLSFPPEHPFWLAQGVHNAAEWNTLGGSKVLRQAYNVRTGKLSRVLKAYFKTAQSAFDRQGTSDKLTYVSDMSEYPKPDEQVMAGKEKLTRDEIMDLLREEGITKNDLTNKDWRLIFDLHDAFNESHEMGSKKGLSLHAYFADDSTVARKRLSRLRVKARKLKERNAHP